MSPLAIKVVATFVGSVGVSCAASIAISQLSSTWDNPTPRGYAVVAKTSGTSSASKSLIQAANGTKKNYKCKITVDSSPKYDESCKLIRVDFTTKKWLKIAEIKALSEAEITAEQLKAENSYYKLEVGEEFFSSISLADTPTNIDVVETTSTTAEGEKFITLKPKFTISTASGTDTINYKNSDFILSSGTPQSSETIVSYGAFCGVGTSVDSITPEAACTLKEVTKSSGTNIADAEFTTVTDVTSGAVDASKFYLTSFTDSSHLAKIENPTGKLFFFRKQSDDSNKTEIASFTNFKPVIYSDTAKTTGFILA